MANLTILDIDKLLEEHRRALTTRIQAERALGWAEEARALHRATVACDPLIANGKNEDTRKAQTTLALAEDKTYSQMTDKVDAAKLALAEADAAVECSRTRLRLIEAWLRGQAT